MFGRKKKRSKPEKLLRDIHNQAHQLEKTIATIDDAIEVVRKIDPERAQELLENWEGEGGPKSKVLRLIKVLGQAADHPEELARKLKEAQAVTRALGPMKVDETKPTSGDHSDN